MADMRVNEKGLENLLRRYQPDAVTRHSVGGGTEFLMRCPFHNDTHASLHVNLTKGKVYCFACPSKQGRTLPELISKLEGITEAKASIMLRKEGAYDREAKRGFVPKEKREIACDIPQDQVTRWHEALVSNAAALTELTNVTGWTPATVDRFSIGYTGSAFTIPLYTLDTLANVKYYKPRGTPKYSGVPNSNKPFLWPLDVLNSEGTIWLVEGEKDCILANQLGMNAMTFTGGAGVIPFEYLSRLKDRDVNILYDIDPVGRSGATSAANALAKVSKSIKIIELPEDGMPANGDLTDFIVKLKHDVSEVLQIADMTDPFVANDVRSKVVIPSGANEVYLEDIISKKHFFQHVRMSVRVVSVSQGNTYLVPKEVHLTCARDLGEHCHSCALNYADGRPLSITVKPDMPEIMQMVNGTDLVQRKTICKLLEVFPKCSKVNFEFASFQAFYPVVLIPALEKDKPNHSYMMYTAWALDIPAETNEDYSADAVVMTHPDTQAMVILCYRLEKDMTSVDQFELTEEMLDKLRIFQCTTPTVSEQS